jgi:hypothetical protein
LLLLFVGWDLYLLQTWELLCDLGLVKTQQSFRKEIPTCHDTNLFFFSSTFPPSVRFLSHACVVVFQVESNLVKIFVLLQHTYSDITIPKMKLAIAALLASSAAAFAPSAKPAFTTSLAAEIRGPTEKAKELRFGWDGTLGGAVEVAKPSRMLEDIRASGELIPEKAELFNANLEMSGDEIMFEEVIELIDELYEYGLIEFKNGDVVNMQGENEGTAKVLSYAALSNLDKETTLKLWGQYYRDVLKNPDGTDHANIRNFMKTGWEGVSFDYGIALTRKNTGDNEWDWDAESWIP